MTYSALQVANTFLDFGAEEEYKINPLKLLCLVYLANGWYLAINEKPLIDDPVISGKYIPIVESVYDEFKHYGNHDIIATIRHLPIIEPGLKEYDVVKKVWDTYKAFTSIQLSNYVHNEESPWIKTSQGKSISNDLIMEYFKKKAQN